MSKAIPRVQLWMLAVFTFSGTLAMHIFVPALAMAGKDLGASNASMQMTVSLYILGLAGGQLVYGPLSDRFGCRPVLMGGLFIYTLAGLAAALAPDAHALIAARLFQALGGCAGLVLARAIVRDTAADSSAAKRLALMNMMVMISPALAPLLGSFLAATLGWRSILVVLCLLGVANLLLAWRKLPETLPQTAALTPSRLLRDYRALFRSPRFVGYTLGGGCATTSMYAFVASAPFIFIDQLHRPEHEVGVYLAILVSGVWLGNAICGRLLNTVPIDCLLMGGNLLSAISVLPLLVCVLGGVMNTTLTMGLMFVFCVGAGACSPAALTLAMSVNPQVIGSASGLYGCTQMAIGAICTSLAGLGSSPLRAAVLVIAVACVLSQFALRMAQSSRDPAPAAS
ncbi:multidrug effflux MFS transporter [Bordetella holmesii]|uniref:multidrug effflux MFS transporter n=1 Tax=Bordetella holmesii TaxID=35814 RepID=UPI00045A93C1|nr:multidrug effflux MFS transporter [Bordetella holmesii]KCV10430.1 drug resistance transporter, Bcr/CflA family [Bordetella holmesii 04P3421]QGF01798.1 multidrug effflux MFS transporter [Bordetella holmesii]